MSFREINKDIEILKSLRVKSPILKEIEEILNDIHPATVEVERVFSIAGVIFSEQRKRLSIEMLDSIVFLKYWFHNQKENRDNK